MQWVNAKKRKPEKFGKYFIKMNGVHNIYYLQEFDGMITKMGRSDVLLWLDENQRPDEVIEKPKEIIKKVIVKEYIPVDCSNDQEDRKEHLDYLVKLFGFKKGMTYNDKIKKHIKSRINQL